MTSSPKITDRSAASEADDRCDLGIARAKDVVFDAVYDMWARREAEGLKKKDIASILNKHPSWVTRSLAGPANWTIETFGALAEAMDSNIEIVLIPREDIIPDNYDIYSDIIDGVPHSYCPIGCYSASGVSSGSKYTFNVGKAASPKGASTVIRTKIEADA